MDFEEELKKLSEEMLFGREDIETIAAFVRDMKEEFSTSIETLETENERLEEKILALLEQLRNREEESEYATYIKELISQDADEREKRHLEMLKEYIDTQLAKKPVNPLLQYAPLAIAAAALILAIIK